MKTKFECGIVLLAMRRLVTFHMLLGGFLFGAVILSQAQNYSLSWFTIAGGGGSSSGTATNGTAYAVSGTIGQSDAGVLSGGPYTVTGGFWGVIGSVQTPGSPLLNITVASPNVKISWPASATGFTLQKNSDLNTTNWTTVTQSTNVVNGTNIVTVPAPNGNLFFRLKN
ncbi:MAG TPA: hypothetical protein VFC07_12685 [Verrucomicrobiae bacterium]|nr:hypothetical protein [Verrucomicrobiae bacterium]